MQELLKKAGLTPAILQDAQRRTAAINEYNAHAGGLRALIHGGKLDIAETHPIASRVSASDVTRYLKFVGAGKRAPIIFAAGRATRMKLPSLFDRLGIAGLTGNLLSRINSLREGDDAPAKRLEADGELQTLIEAACSGKARHPEEFSLLQRQITQYRVQVERLLGAYPASGATLRDWLSKASFVVVANEANRKTLEQQLAGIGFAGFNEANVLVTVQREAGGLEVLPDGTTRDFDEDRWPEGHGKPFMDLGTDGLLEKLSSRGVERAVFAQVNDLHLLEDMAHVERWTAADALIASGAEMVMEMVENGLSQKGGGIFHSPDGNTVMRDTIAMKTADLEPYSVPRSLSRMFYELTLEGLLKLRPGTLPAYITERTSSSGKTVLTCEFYSGDASGLLKASAVQQKGYVLDTFKMQSRIPHTLEALRRQAATHLE